MNYTPKKAFKKIDKLTREGYPLRLALYVVSNELDLNTETLRLAYEKRTRRNDFLSDALLALVMAGFFFSPVFFYLLAKATQ
jgi:hypothetical protein